ncbi:class I adenylate-forming enzyme family protein [Pseudonocardia sp. McavD-2-B]|uniref:class I adenylate-forming enzyme family protein n=1 Tax=Pseudonocardia sp. McavD-2-B TaxID=2954499 RepID=UPI0020984448|nr:class I adenylate-forming enzyme family protein [Pseudonocardia sp. McavD-2-B]MCO7191513.1 acyl--CoA ligase [Pseudonocardia sp. McavD-2-B]
MYHEGLNQTVNRVLDESCRRWGTRTALVEGDRRWSYLELRREVARLTHGLRTAGITQEDRVAFLIGVTSDWIVLYYSLMRIGAVAVPLNLTWEGREIHEGLTLTQATVLVATEDFRGADYVARTVGAVEINPVSGEDGRSGRVTSDALPYLRMLISVEGSGRHAPLAASLVELKEEGTETDAAGFAALSSTVHPDTHSIYLLTSGTSSFPKPVIHDHQSLLVGVANYADGVEATSDDSTLIIAPNYHVAAYFTVLMLHLRGGAVHLTPHFLPRNALKIIERERISLLFGFDVHFLMLKRDPMFELYDFSSVTRTMIGSSPASFDEIAAMGVQHQGNIYGSSEYVAAQTFFPFRDRHDTARMRTSHGRPGLGMQLRIVDFDTGLEVPTGEPGEICFKGPALFKGYYNMPDETKSAFDDDGFFHSGDIGWVDADGYLYYRGRRKETVKSGGENVSMQEVELFLQLETEGVAKALVVAMPDPRWGEQVCAIIEPAPGTTFDEAAIIASCRGRIAGYKIPKRVVRAETDNWTYTPTGKLDRRAMTEWVKRRDSAD